MPETGRPRLFNSAQIASRLERIPKLIHFFDREPVALRQLNGLQRCKQTDAVRVEIRRVLGTHQAHSEVSVTEK
jgi:hypothetical protein